MKEQVKVSLGLCCANGAEPWVQDMQLHGTTASGLLYTPAPTGITGTLLLGPVELLGGMALSHFLSLP